METQIVKYLLYLQLKGKTVEVQEMHELKLILDNSVAFSSADIMLIFGNKKRTIAVLPRLILFLQLTLDKLTAFLNSIFKNSFVETSKTIINNIFILDNTQIRGITFILHHYGNF